MVEADFKEGFEERQRVLGSHGEGNFCTFRQQHKRTQGARGRQESTVSHQVPMGERGEPPMQHCVFKAQSNS